MKDKKQLLNEQLFISVEENFAAHFDRLPTETFMTVKPTTYEDRTESHEQPLFACELITADERECGGRWNQLLCYP